MVIKIKKNIKKILLVRPVAELIHTVGHPRDIRIPFLLKYMESLLIREGSYNTYLIDCMANHMDFEKLINLSIEYLPDIVILSSTTLEYSLTLRYAYLLKKSLDAIFILVGQDATASPERYIYSESPIDIVLRGESELSFMKLLQAINYNEDVSQIEGLCMRNYSHPYLAIVRNLDDLPFPVFSREELRRYVFYYPLPVAKKIIWGHMLTSRGCPYNCIFCSQLIRESYGNEVRLRSHSNIVDEMLYLKEQGANVIAFDDDNFTTSKTHIIGICEEIIRRNLKIMWSAHARIDNCDKDLLKIMKEAGCVLLRFGIESGSEKIIRILEKTKDTINWIERARDVFKIARKINLSTAALFLIGNPLENKKDIERSISLAKELNPDLLQVCFFTTYPGSPAYEKFKIKISSEDIKEMYHYRPPKLNFSNISTNELQNLYKKFYRKVLFKPKYIVNHIARYGLFYLYNKDIFSKLFTLRKLIFN